MEANGQDVDRKQTLVTPMNFPNVKNLTKSEHVHNLFNKRFPLIDTECYSLPKPERMFTCPVWEIEQLQVLKRELNNIKNSLNNYNHSEWHSHTHYRNSAKNVIPYLKKQIQPEFVTQAWCKFYEIVSSFPLVPVTFINNNSNGYFKSIHLCEAPGAFVTSLNHWLKTNVSDIQWDWIATTLNPYYEGYSSSEMITDDRFIRHTLNHWCFGEDNTGNLMNLKNLNNLLKISEPHNNVYLVTADGSTDCLNDPGEQENIVAHLHFCETVTALHLLCNGGSFLLKIFTIFECHSVCLIYLLCCCFNKVTVVKPATSKEGNSETYVVCIDFKGLPVVLPYLKELKKYYECDPKKAMFNYNDIPSAFIEKIIECNKFFNYHQSLVIMNNIITFKSDNIKILNKIKKIQHAVADKYITDYNIKKLISGEIVGNTKLETWKIINISKRVIYGSYTERCEQHHLAPQDQLKTLFDHSNRIKIDIPSDRMLQFKITELPKNLQITSGKVFHRIYSSGFCHHDILKIKNEIDNILINMGCKMQYPSPKHVNQLKEKILCKTEYKILAFKYTDAYDSHKVIEKMYDTMQNLNIGDTLILTGYSLLTHLNVGLLYLISCAFNLITLKFCNNIGSKITLQHYNYNMKILKYLIDLKATSSNIQEKGNAILQILPAVFLYDSDLFYPIVTINHWIVKSYIHYVFTTLQESSEIKEEK